MVQDITQSKLTHFRDSRLYAVGIRGFAAESQNWMFLCSLLCQI